MIGLTDLRPGFGGGEGNDKSSELLGTGDLFCGVGGGVEGPGEAKRRVF